MYISIDHDKMRFRHKHPDFRVIANLDYIAGAWTSVGPAEFDTIKRGHFTDMELGLLYKHTTGHDHIPAVGDALRMILTELAELFPVTDVDPVEAEAQAAWLEERDPDKARGTKGKQVKGWAYVRGSKVPRRTDDVLWPDPLPMTPEQVGNAVRKHTAAQAARAAARPATPAPPVPSAPPAPRKAASRPRTGVCAQIWEVLDAERAATGEAPSRDRVKELAAQHGWNKNTASVQSAAWRKENSLP